MIGEQQWVRPSHADVARWAKGDTVGIPLTTTGVYALIKRLAMNLQEAEAALASIERADAVLAEMGAEERAARDVGEKARLQARLQPTLPRNAVEAVLAAEKLVAEQGPVTCRHCSGLGKVEQTDAAQNDVQVLQVLQVVQVVQVVLEERNVTTPSWLMFQGPWEGVSDIVTNREYPEEKNLAPERVYLKELSPGSSVTARPAPTCPFNSNTDQACSCWLCKR